MMQLQNPQCIPLQRGIVYGPIRSRRLGNSLGINPLPTTYKLCSSNCVYCQYGWTTNENVQGERLPSAADIVAAAEAAFRATEESIAWVTLAGNGEPTLHPQLEQIVTGLRALRDAHLPHACLGILSDATTAHRSSVRRALAGLDARYMKLDVGSAEAFARVNQPMGQVDWDQMIEALRTLPETTLQSMFVSGSVDNSHPADVADWVDAVTVIRPIGVQVYSIDRPPAESGLRQVPRARLQEIAAQLRTRLDAPVEVF